MPPIHPRQRWMVVVVLVVCLVLLASVAILCIDIMSAARAYVAGESLWSKEQKEAVKRLNRYAVTRASEDWDAYRAAIAIPLGDRVVREQLEKSRPDMDALRRGYRDGGNDLDEFDGVVQLFRWFRWLPFVAHAVALWERGDALIAELVVAAEELHRAVQAGADNATLEPALARIHALDQALRPLEGEFSVTLGRVMHRARAVLITSLLSVAALLIAAGAYTVHRLVRRRELYEAALRSSEERVRRALEAARDGIWDWNIRTGSMYFSPRCEALFGLAPGTLPRSHRQLLSWIHPDDLPHVRAATQAHLQHNEPYDVEFRARNDEDWRWVRSRGQAVLDSENDEVRMVGSLTDVDERRRAEEALRESNERLEQRVAERTAELSAANLRLRELDLLKSQFLDGLSHELRAPLDAIVGSSTRLHEGPEAVASPPQRQQVERIREAGERLLTLVDQVLDVFAIESGRTTLERSSFDFAEIVDSVVARLRRLADHKGLRIEVDVPRTGMQMTGDRRRTAQVLHNLIGDAIKSARAGRVGVLARRNSREIEVVVGDTGSAPDRATARAHAGSGPGLPLTGKLLGLLGGEIAAESRPGQGPTFRFTLPVGAVSGTTAGSAS